MAASCLCQGGLSTVDQLLLDIYSQIQEPDGIYAAARSQKAASQLCLFEHEGAWDKALVGYDLLQLGESKSQVLGCGYRAYVLKVTRIVSACGPTHRQLRMRTQKKPNN
jgi:hypothetical protein